MPDIIDVSFQCGGAAQALAAAGVKTVIRYYSRDTGLPAKRLTRAEAGQLAAAGLTIGAVHEARHGDRLASFSQDLGRLDGAYARTYAAATIGQPAGSAIYFAVDFDAAAGEIAGAVVPYFRGVAQALAAPTGEPAYEVGVYGSGATCAAVLDAQLATRAWLCQSTGWSGYDAFDQSGRWALKQGLPAKVAEVACDPDQASAAAVIGDFTPAAAQLPASAAPLLQVIARSGAHLRAGPGTDFASLALLPYGADVRLLKTQDGWTLVDLHGDGKADGFVSAPLLASATDQQ